MREFTELLGKIKKPLRNKDSSNTHWVQENRSTLTKQFPNEWVIIENSQIIAHSNNMRELNKMMVGKRRKGQFCVYLGEINTDTFSPHHW